MTLTLGSVGATYGGLTGKSGKDFGHGTGRYVTFTEVMSASRLIGRSLERVDVHRYERQHEVRRGDVLFNGSSETPEEVALGAVVDFDVPRGVYLNSFCFGYRLTQPNEVDPTYLAYFFRSAAGRDIVFGLAQGATRYNIAKTKLLKTPLDVPSYEQQKAIAATLSQVDDVIASLERLITKKRAIKQGMMQELLTGRTRLPGFDRQWDSKRLGDLLSYQQPGRYLVSSTDYVDAGTPVLTAGKTFVLGFTNETSGIYESLPVIIFDDFTTASKYVDFPFKAKSSAMKILSSTDGADLRFMFERMQAIDFVAVDHKRRWIAEYSKIEVAVPDIAEQRAIARVAADANAEVEALERRLEATREIKQGVMQELLTGRTRLPIGEEVAV